MSNNKKIRNRLSQIFNDIAEPESQESGQQREIATPVKKPGKPAKTKPSSQPVLAAQNGRLHTPESSNVTTAVVTDSGSGEVSTLSIPFNVGDTWNNIEIIDEKDRKWNSEEQTLVRDVVGQLTLALQNARLFQQTQRQNSNLEILNEMGRELATQLDVSQVIESAYKYTSQLLDTGSYFLALLDNETEALSFPVVTVDGKRIEFPDRKMGSGLTDYVLRTRKPVLLNGDVSSQMNELGIEFIPLGNTKAAVSWLGVPLAIGKRTLGAIVVQSTEIPYLYTEQERDLLVAVASQTAIALQNAQLFEQTETQREDLAVLNEMAREITSLLTIETVAQAVYKYAGRLMDVTDFFVALYHPENEEMSFPAIYFDGEPSTIERTSIGNGLTAKVLRSREPVLLPDRVAERAREIGVDILLIGDDSIPECWLGVPLTLGQQVLGAIVVQNNKTPNLYNDRHQNLLVAMAGQVSIALQNAKLYQDIQVSETRFRDVALASADWVWEVDLQGRYTYCSDKVFDVLGYRPEEMYGKHMLDFMPVYESERIAPIMENVLTKQERMVDFENRTLTQDGREIILTTNGLPILDENDVMIGYRGVNKDVTAQRLDEAIDEVIADIVKVGVETEIVEKALEQIHQSILKIVPARNIYFSLYDRENNIISYPFKVDEKDSEPWEPHQPSNNLTHYVIRSDKSLFMTSEEIDKLTETGEIKRYGSPSRQWMGIPLKTKEVIGMFATQVYDDNLELTNEHFEILKRLAPQISTVVEKIRAEEALSKSEAELRVLFNSMQDVIIVFNDEGRYVRIAPTNPSRLLLPAEELLGKTVHEVVPDELQPVFMDAIERGLKSDQAIQFEYPLNIGGEKVWFDANVSKLSEREVFWVARDVTERKFAEEALRRQNDYLATATEVGRLITSTLDLPTLFERTVNLLRSRFGYYHVSIFTVEETGFNAVLQEGTGQAGEEMKRRQHSLTVGSKSIIGYVTGNGNTLVVNNTAIDSVHRPNPLLPETRAEAAIPLKIGSRIIGAIDIQSREVGAFLDADIAILETLADQIAVAIDNARSYELAQRAVNEMRELDRIKSQFLANMSHELRTPLNSIIGFSRVILKGIDGPINEQQQQDLSAIYNSGQHLLNLINDVLDLSKIEAGKMELALEELNIADTINSVMSTAVGLVKDKPVKLLKELETNIPAVRADAMRIRQVLINLVANAAKFTDEGTITIQASSHINSSGNKEVLVSIKDTGPGISPEDQKKLFQAFSQVDSSPTRKSGGSGLGLSICQRLVELHNGKIGVHSAVGEGSTFYFTIPVYHQDTIETDTDNRVILCIDDDPQIIGLYERYLKPQGYTVVPLVNPANAKDTIKRIKPYAVTLDIMMPELDGWQVLSDIKNDPEIRDVPVIVCSIVEEEEKGFSLGAADYLVKPILEDDLLGALNQLNGDGSIHEVLIIDDSQDDLRLIERIISEKNAYQPVLAQGGEQGWKLITQKKPQAIILDLFMPDLDGFEIMERLKTSPDLREIPVLVISGAELNETEKQKLDNLGKIMLQKGMLEQDQLFELLEKSLSRLKKI
jgi:PAS domain S-box-containing protein